METHPAPPPQICLAGVGAASAGASELAQSITSLNVQVTEAHWLRNDGLTDGMND